MNFDQAAVVDVRPLIARERADFVELLRTLDGAGWECPTMCSGWSVKDVAAHVLADDLGWLSRTRDHDMTGLLTDGLEGQALVQALNAKNQAWVDVLRELSPHVLCDLLTWVGRQMDEVYAETDLAGTGFVVWAGGDVPAWFDVAQDLTEHWLHQRQVREAVGRAHLTDPYVRTVLHTLVWALPHHYRTFDAPRGAALCLEILGPDGGNWTLTRDDDAWRLDELPSTSADTQVVLTTEAAWRLFAGAPTNPGELRVSGDERLAAHFSSTRAFIV